MDVLYYIGVGLGFVMIGFVMAGFWRGLSLKATDPRTRVPEHETWRVGHD